MQKFDIPTGYTILDVVSETHNTDYVLLNCERNTDLKHVTIKFGCNESKKEYIASQLEQDHKCSKHIERLLGPIYSRSFSESFGILYHNNTAMLVKEFVPGLSLESFISTKSFKGGTSETLEFLSLSLKMVKILEDVHKCNVIVGNINPSSFIYEPSTGLIRLVDFLTSEMVPSKCNYIPFNTYSFDKVENCVYIARMFFLIT